MRLRVAAMGLLLFIETNAALAADNAVCGNIRLSATEQFQCRYRLDNALGPGDAQRTREEYEYKARAATNALITPSAPLKPLPALPDATLKLPDTPDTVPRESGALRLPKTPSLVPENGGVLHLPNTPSGAPVTPKSRDAQ